MDSVTVYQYERCGSCRKARQWLEDQNVAYQTLPIREQPPTQDQLAAALQSAGGNIRKIINTGSVDYRESGLKDKVDSLPHEEIFSRLSQNGNLIKRPFLVAGQNACAGFDIGLWKRALAL